MFQSGHQRSVLKHGTLFRARAGRRQARRFEEGYGTVMAKTTPPLWRNFRRRGGVKQTNRDQASSGGTTMVVGSWGSSGSAGSGSGSCAAGVSGVATGVSEGVEGMSAVPLPGLAAGA